MTRACISAAGKLWGAWQLEQGKNLRVCFGTGTVLALAPSRTSRSSKRTDGRTGGEADGRVDRRADARADGRTERRTAGVGRKGCSRHAELTDPRAPLSPPLQHATSPEKPPTRLTTRLPVDTLLDYPRKKLPVRIYWFPEGPRH